VPSIPNGGGSITLLLNRLSSNPAGMFEEWDCCEAISKFGSCKFSADGSLAANAGVFDKVRHSPTTTAPNSRRDAPSPEVIGANFSRNTNALVDMTDMRLIVSGCSR